RRLRSASLMTADLSLVYCSRRRPEPPPSRWLLRPNQLHGRCAQALQIVFRVTRFGGQYRTRPNGGEISQKNVLKSLPTESYWHVRNFARLGANRSRLATVARPQAGRGPVGANLLAARPNSVQKRERLTYLSASGKEFGELVKLATPALLCAGSHLVGEVRDEVHPQ